MVISEHMTVTEAVENYPHALATLNRLGLHCEDYLSPQAHAETLGDACKANGIEIEQLISALKESVAR